MADPPRLRDTTAARIGLGRVGQALPTGPMLDFQLAHARARDAVLTELRSDALGDRPVIEVHSQARDRAAYLQRPDLGRRLDVEDMEELQTRSSSRRKPGSMVAGERNFGTRVTQAPPTIVTVDPNFRGNDEMEARHLVLIVGDGLSATAVHSHAAPLLDALLVRLDGWTIAPIILARHARVALGDEIGAALGVDLAIMLIGERPGLSAPDSLGAYITWEPRPGRRDSERNCVSNIRPPDGLGYAEASDRIAWLAREARARRLTGVALKDESSVPRLA